GIAVGMATEIPSHNLTEVAQAARLMLENPETTLDEILAVMPGPDFATGGQIISTPEEIRDVYATGRGSVRVRARYTFEDLARGQWRLVVTQLPPNTSSQKVLSEIEDLTNPKVKVGKKVLSAEQQQTRAAMLSMLEAVRDESGKTEDVRLVFEPKSKNQDRDEFVRTLLSKTSMEGNVPVNLVFVGLDGKPRQKALTEILAEWVAFRIQTVRRRTQYRLEKALDRIHILEGRKLVFLNLEDVIALIRESDDPKVALMAKYPLSERQADDILEIRLRQLARLEGIRIEAELSELQKTREKLEDLLGNEKRLTALISREIAQDAQNYGDERRTLIEADSQTRVDKKIVDEPVTVIVSKMGYLRQRTGHGHDASIMNYRANDAFAVSFECRTTDTLVAFGSTGRVYSIPVANLPNAKGDGQYVTNFTELEPGEKILHYLQASEDATVLIATSAGSGLVCEFKDLISKIRTGKAFIKLEKGDTVLAPQVVTSDRPLVAALSEGGRLLIFPAQDVRRLPKGGQGVTLMDLGSREKLLAIATVSEAGLTVSGTGRGGKDREERIRRAKFEKYLGNRARKGKVLEIHFKATQLTALGGSEVFDDTAEDEPQAPETNLDLL
ncbi:MAG TPA: DNA topoisomerase IV subunit A, partial [Sutterella sp.]|nr:DNA topoisomerase IV subunit A [Sutterella sp.]